MEFRFKLMSNAERAAFQKYLEWLPAHLLHCIDCGHDLSVSEEPILDADGFTVGTSYRIEVIRTAPAASPSN